MVGGFVVFCGPLYAPGSISDVIVPALKRMDKRFQGLDNSARLSGMMPYCNCQWSSWVRNITVYL
jgi:hypothetical protein